MASKATAAVGAAADPDVRASQSPREFTIVSGAHRGATFALSEDLLLIGADAGCDVRLSDTGLASRHAAVMADGRGVALRSLEGLVSVNGQQLAPSAGVELAPGSEIALGDTGVRLRLGGPTPSATVERSGERQSQRVKGKPRMIAASMLVVVGIVVAGVLTQQLRPVRAAAIARPAPVISAAVPSDAELVEQIRDVFRTHGLDAEITQLGAGRMRIENLDASHERVRRAMARIRADVPALGALTFASPADAEPPAEPPLYESGPEGRMSIHVEGGTAYLSSGDGGRYFAGSVLPSGYAVRRITSSAVQVDRDGQIGWFRF
jgi:hypothetical protein